MTSNDVTIIADRYGGTYSNGRFIAVPVSYQSVEFYLDGSPMDDDNSVQELWDRASGLIVGRGQSPNEAYEDLRRQLDDPPS